MPTTLALTLALLTAAAPKFVPYDAKADGFRIDFPGKPKVETEKDKTLITRTYAVEGEAGVYMGMVLSDPGITTDDAKEYFDGLRETQKQDAKILSDKPITLGSIQGIELRTQGKDLDGIARMFITKGRVYTFIVDVEHGGSFTAAGADQFFASLVIGTEKASAAAPPPAAPPAKTAAPAQKLSDDHVELFGWSPDGTKVAWIENGISDGKGTPWAKVTFFDTSKGAPLGKPLELELEDTERTREDVVAEAMKRAEAERVRLKLPAFVPGKRIATDAKGELTSKDGSPIGNLEVKLRKAGKKERVRECPEGFAAELISAKLFLMGGDAPLKVADEKKTPAARACSMGCTPTSTYGQGKGALFILKCSVQTFEGADYAPTVLPLGKLEFPLEADLPAE